MARVPTVKIGPGGETGGRRSGGGNLAPTAGGVRFVVIDLGGRPSPPLSGREVLRGEGTGKSLQPVGPRPNRRPKEKPP